MNKIWAIISLILIAAILTGGVVLGLHLPKNYLGQQMEISVPSPDPSSGMVYVHGSVHNPGFYALHDNDTLASLIQAAGGASADLTVLELVALSGSANATAQKIDINRADPWLLDALPGIGEVLAQRIVDYRDNNGSFHNKEELLKVKGISASVYDKIKDLITVSE